ncbi:hypothetical protein ACH5RR_014980 [Cinchona calisaya]|uniref:Uncharacterized protein n=1 Tax=Cinchona calisaya TaxID=153742 RepID=A0ABD2ZTI2_9GENT
MAITAVSVEQLEAVFEGLKDEKLRTIVLVGEPGVGKTWIARKLSERAIRRGLFDLSLWFSLNRPYGFLSLHGSIARQLSLLPVHDEWEFENDSPDLDEIDMDIEQKKKYLKAKTSEALEGKKFLLILDDEGSQTKDDEILPELKVLLPLDGRPSYKYIITSTKHRDDPGSDGSTKIIKVQHLSENESLLLLQELVEKEIYARPPITKLAKYFLGKSKILPYEVIIIAKILSYFEQNESRVRHLESFMEENVEGYNILQLLSYGHDLLPSNILFDCCCIDNHFLRKRGGVYFSELISYWILETYLGNFDSIEDAYKVGHSVLMELIGCGVLKQLESGYVSVTVGKHVFNDFDYRKFAATTHLGLATVFDGDLGRIMQAKGMIKAGGAVEGRKKISTLFLDVDHLNSDVPDDFFQFRKDLKALAIFNPGLRPFPLPLFEMDKLSLLVLRGCSYFVSIDHILEFVKPTVPEISAPSCVLGELTVLEISGPSSLQEIPDNIFSHMPHLKSLNLSFLPIASLPLSLYSLKELVWLILRGCSHLQELRSLKMFDKLQVLDLSGARSLKFFQDKSLSSNQELRILNLSGSQIISLPLLRNLSKLTHLLLCDCNHLDRLRKITALSSLQILDLSGSTNFKEFVDPSFEKLTSLKVINVSQTAVKQLPLDIRSLRQLCIRNCSELKELPFVESIKGLQELDLSGSCNLENIEESFFKDLSCLRVLNLSKTKIKSLPAISNSHNLRHLLLSHCLYLETLGELNSMTKLEILDLSGCKALKEIKGKSLENMHSLQKLDLSGTSITCLPSLSSRDLRHLILKSCSNLNKLPSLEHLSSLEELNLSGVGAVGESGLEIEHMVNLSTLDLSETQIKKLPFLLKLKNLNHLSLRDCPSLSELPGVESLPKLEVLNLSGTAVKDLPSLKNLANLQRLLLKGCLNLEKFKHLEIRDTLEAAVKELPYDISKVTCLEQLEPPIFSAGGHDAEKNKCPPQDLSQFQWIVSSWPVASVSNNKLIITLNSVEILQALEKNPSFWETSFSQFHFFVHPIEAYGRFGDKNFYRNELFLRDLYFKTRQLSTPIQRARSLEIRGFHCFPRCLGLILVHAEFVFLVDNPFVTCLSDVGAENIKKMKVCWIERCTEMKDLFHTEKVADAAKSGGSASANREDAAKSGGSANTEVLEKNAGAMFRMGECLEILCVSYATNLKSMCLKDLQSSSLKNLKSLFLEHCPQISAVCFPPEQLGNLEALQIRFCHNLVALFEHKQAAFPKLHTLKLWALPELDNIEYVLPALLTLEIGECPKLVNVFSSNQLPECLQKLQIKFCDRLETVFVGSNVTLPNLQMLCLWNLPELKSIGADMPLLMQKNIRECPKLPRLSYAYGGRDIYFTCDRKLFYPGIGWFLQRVPWQIWDNEQLTANAFFVIVEWTHTFGQLKNVQGEEKLNLLHDHYNITGAE